MCILTLMLNIGGGRGEGGRGWEGGRGGMVWSLTCTYSLYS